MSAFWQISELCQKTLIFPGLYVPLKISSWAQEDGNSYLFLCLQTARDLAGKAVRSKVGTKEAVLCQPDSRTMSTLKIFSRALKPICAANPQQISQIKQVEISTYIIDILCTKIFMKFPRTLLKCRVVLVTFSSPVLFSKFINVCFKSWAVLKVSVGFD